MEEHEDWLPKLDLIRDRLGVSYREAKEALEQTGGSVIDAIILLEGSQADVSERIQAGSEKMVARLKGIIHKGNTTRIKVKKGDRTLVEIPATLGALGVVGMLASTQLAVAGALGAVAALANKWTIEVERPRRKPELEPEPEL